jgi:hypothetical protein
MTPKRVVFFNYFHNGDVHLSRGLVRQIISKVHQTDPTVQFAYGHKNDPTLLSDIPNLGFDPNALSIINNEHANLHVVGETVYINTWYGQQHHKYMNRYGGLTMDTLYDALSESCQSLWNFSLSDISADPTIFFPIIDYSKYNIEPVQKWLDQHSGKKILIENGPALSDQATNFSMAPIITQIATKHPNVSFILTSRENIDMPSNIFQSSNITNRSTKTDLNEISFLSTYCDMVIGRSSGVFAFTMTQQNLFERKITFLSFSNFSFQPGKYWLGDLLKNKITYNSPILFHNESNPNEVLKIIERNL